MGKPTAVYASLSVDSHLPEVGHIKSTNSKKKDLDTAYMVEKVII